MASISAHNSLKNHPLQKKQLQGLRSGKFNDHDQPDWNNWFMWLNITYRPNEQNICWVWCSYMKQLQSDSLRVQNTWATNFSRNTVHTPILWTCWTFFKKYFWSTSNITILLTTVSVWLVMST
jgi:hypothetical protein